MMRPGNRGFTLIELLIVVVIIGILASIAIPKFASVRQKSFRSSMMSDLRNLAVTQEVYHNDNFSYTNSLTALEAVVTEGITLTITEASNTGWAATATHSGIAGQQCGVFNGSASAANGSPATAVGVVTCTF